MTLFDAVQNFSATPKSFVLAPKDEFTKSQIIFWSGTKILGLAQYVNQFLVWHKTFGPAQNVLGPGKRTRHMPQL